MGWDTSQMGDLSGQRVVITGANSGIGREATRVLVAKGCDVVAACRDLAKGEEALSSLAPGGGGKAELARLDLADFASIREFAGGLASSDRPVTALVANGAVMACPYALSKDGFELQMATNHLGHALLTALLLPQLAPGARIVFVSSLAARGGRLGPDSTAEQLAAPAPYSAQTVYSNTKQANLAFSQELNRRLAASGRPVVALAVHPGVSATELFLRQLRDSHKEWLVPFARPVMQLVLQSAAAGALPILRALTDPAVRGGEFIGPRHLGQTRGAPEFLTVYAKGADRATAARLFELTEELIASPILPA